MAASEGRTRPAAFVEDTAVAPERLVRVRRRGFRAILERAGLSAGFYGHCSVGCLHIRPVRRPLPARPGRDDARGRRGGRRARRVVRRRELLRARRRPRPLAVQPAHLRRRALRARCARSSGSSTRTTAQPGRDGRRRAADRAPARRRAAAAAARSRPTSDFPEGSMHAAADRCQRIGACRKTGTRRDVPVLHGHARGGARHARARQRAREGALASPTPAPRWATSACTRSSTSAWSARRARASARCRSTWRR